MQLNIINRHRTHGGVILTLLGTRSTASTLIKSRQDVKPLMANETTSKLAELNKAVRDAEAGVVKAKSVYDEFVSGKSREELLDLMEEAYTLKGAIPQAEKAVAQAKKAIEDFQINQRAEQLTPINQALVATAKTLDLAAFKQITIDLAIGEGTDDPNLVTGSASFVQRSPDTAQIVAALAETLKPQIALAKRLGFPKFTVKVTGLDTTSPVFDAGRTDATKGLNQAGKAAARKSGEAATSTPKSSEFSPGQTLVATYKGAQYSCTVTPDGKFLYDGKEYGSSSSAGTAVTGGSVNGNRFWKVAA